jgi:uncharacterized membrane protein YdjX (TVP38/TMEM64 family)
MASFGHRGGRGSNTGERVTTRDLKPASQPRAGRWRFVPLALLLLGAGAVLGTGAHRYLSLEAVIEHRERLQGLVEAHAAAAVVVYVGVYVAAVTLSIPGAVFLTILGGFLFGWLLGGAAAVVAATLGAIGVFLIARTSVGDALLRRAGRRIQALAAGFRADALSYLLFLRLLPVVPFWVTNLASAFFGVPLRTFALGTMIGVVPGTYAFAVVGSGLDSVIRAQKEAREACLRAGGAACSVDLSVASLLTPPMIAAIAALAVLALAPVLVRRYLGGRLKGFDPRGGPGAGE